MNTQTPKLAMLLLGLGLVMLAGGSRAQTTDDTSCLADMLSKAGGANGKALMPALMRIMERMKAEGGPEKIMEKVKHMMRVCVCSEESSDLPDAEMCSCIEKMKECDMMHYPNSTETAEAMKGKINSWMDCVGDTMLPTFFTCEAKVLANPVQLMCQSKKLECTQAE